MFKKNILSISYVGALIFIVAPFLYSCSAYFVGLRGFWAAFFPLIFAIGTVASVFVFAIASFAKMGQSLRDGARIAVLVAFLAIYFAEVRHILTLFCHK